MTALSPNLAENPLGSGNRPCKGGSFRRRSACTAKPLLHPASGREGRNEPLRDFHINDQQLLRYSRHILLDEIGIEGQSKLLEAKALIIGVGGLGSPAAFYLASAGVGSITLVDYDQVDLTNLQRQILHTEERVGLNKVDSAKLTIEQLNPHIQIHALCEKVDATRLSELVKLADVVLDCSDNFATRHAVNAACVAHKKPLVSGAAIRFDGQCSVFDVRQKDAPCYACIFPAELDIEEVACSTMGVFAPLVGIIGTMQAAEALKLLMNVGTSLAGNLLLLDARTMEWQQIKAKRNPQCLVCGVQRTEIEND